MVHSGCPLAEYLVPGALVGSFLFGLLLLAITGRKRLSGAEVLFGAWNLFAFVCQVLLDSYFIFYGRVTRKAENETVPKMDDYLGCYKYAVRDVWRQYGEIDTRVYLDEFQPMFFTHCYGAAIVGSALSLLAFIGHLFGCKSAHLWQIAAAAWSLGLAYSQFFPEYLSGFKHVTNMNKLLLMNAPFVVMSFLALCASFCKLCCGSSSTSACPVAPFTTGGDKKKKQ